MKVTAGPVDWTILLEKAINNTPECPVLACEFTVMRYSSTSIANGEAEAMLRRSVASACCAPEIETNLREFVLTSHRWSISHS